MSGNEAIVSYKSKTTLAENHSFLYSTGTKKGVLHCVLGTLYTEAKPNCLGVPTDGPGLPLAMPLDCIHVLSP